jgi:hypothetical protein
MSAHPGNQRYLPAGKPGCPKGGVR